jgi:plastocyanin domain-containing protein
MSRNVALLFSLLAGCGSEEAASPSGARRIEILVDEDGYEPDRVEVRAGEPVTLVFRRTTDRGCGQVLAIPSENIRRELPLGEAVEIPLTAERAGEIRFTCGMDMYDGTIVVTPPS